MCSVRKGVLRNFAKFTGKYLCQGLFCNDIAGLRPATLLKKRFLQRFFLVNFAKFLRPIFLQTPPVAASEQKILEESKCAVSLLPIFRKNKETNI